MRYALSPGVGYPEKLDILGKSGPGATVTVTTEHGSRVWTKRDGGGWVRDLNLEPWDTEQIAELLYRLGGEQTLETLETLEWGTEVRSYAYYSKKLRDAAKEQGWQGMPRLVTRGDAVPQPSDVADS